MGKRWGVILVVMLWAVPGGATTPISPSFLGMYRKTMEIERDLTAYTTQYQVDLRLARAVVIQESGGNASLVSVAGAEGYFQVMPETFKTLGVDSNIEAGIKYLAQMQRQFGREDYAVAAYNAGPGTVSKDRPLRLETLQYVIGVGSYKSVLQLHEAEIRRQAQKLNLYSVQEEDSWDTVAQATKIPVPLLQLYNPFLAPWPLQSGALVVYPPTIPRDVLEYKGKTLYYTSRLGDSYLHLAFVFGIDLEAFRRDNGLWRLQQLPIGQRLHMRVAADSAFLQLRPLLTAKAQRSRTGKGKRGRQSPVGAEAVSTDPSRTHRVRRGETLVQIARRYQTTVETLMDLNEIQNPRVQAGVVLVLPTPPSAT